jgi:hypothetical protein
LSLNSEPTINLLEIIIQVKIVISSSNLGKFNIKSNSKMLLKFQLIFSNSDESQFNPLTDTFYISGSSKYLGEWNLTDAVEMKLKTNKFISNDTGSISSQSSQSSNYSDVYIDEWYV